jgi:hypothetical protein
MSIFIQNIIGVCGRFGTAIIASMSIGLHRLRTGQTSSYRAGDDGDREDGRDTSHTVLANNNPFGNTNRFTDELGGQTYTKDIVIDWSSYDGSTVFGIDRVSQGVGTWNDAIDNALTHSITGFTSGWFLPNKNQLAAWHDLETASAAVMNFSPINNSDQVWSSSTYKGNTGQAWFHTNNGVFTVTAKTNSTAVLYIAMREFTVTGTTLT